MAKTVRILVELGEPFQIDELCPSCWRPSLWVMLSITHAGTRPAAFTIVCHECDHRTTIR